MKKFEFFLKKNKFKSFSMKITRLKIKVERQWDFLERTATSYGAENRQCTSPNSLSTRTVKTSKINFLKIKKRLQSCFTLDCKYQFYFQAAERRCDCRRTPMFSLCSASSEQLIASQTSLDPTEPVPFSVFFPFTVKNGTRGKTGQTENGTETNWTRKMEKMAVKQ